MSRTLRAGIALAAVLAACGCEADETDGTKMTRRDYCAATECDEEEAECTDTRHRQCSECNSACSGLAMETGDTSCWATCSRICGSDRCSNITWCDDTVCLEPGYDFTVAPVRDETLYEACLRMAEFMLRCYPPRPDNACDLIARVFRPEMATLYDCYTSMSCDDDLGRCNEGIPVGTVGTEACDRMDQACGGASTCTERWGRYVDWDEPLLRPDVVDALRSCFWESSCGQVSACIDAWSTALYGD